MPFPLATVLNAAPGLISAAAEIIGLVKSKKISAPPEANRYEELTALIEQQAKVIEELALNNRNLVLAVRNNRIMALASLTIAVCAIVIAVWQ